MHLKNQNEKYSFFLLIWVLSNKNAWFLLSNWIITKII